MELRRTRVGSQSSCRLPEHARAGETQQNELDYMAKDCDKRMTRRVAHNWIRTTSRRCRFLLRRDEIDDSSGMPHRQCDFEWSTARIVSGIDTRTRFNQ